MIKTSKILRKKELKENRPSMEQIWMELAEKLRNRSTCSRLHVGCVITSQNLERVYSVGYNGGAKGQKNECDSLLPGGCGHLHAEINALIKCQINDPNKILFATNLPCPVCAKAIVNSGFSKVYYREDYRLDESKRIFKKAKIQLERIK